MVDAVVKVGGRLGRDDGLRPLCLRLADLGRRHGLLVVPGGGIFADAVRACDARFALSADAAHWMAILAMDQYGHLLGELVPGARLVRSLSGAAEAADDGVVPVLLPHDLLRETDPLPHSWAVSSDAIAAWVAATVGARRLVLLKHRTAFAAPPPGSPRGAGPREEKREPSEPREVSLDELAAWDAVDEAFAVELGGDALDVWLLDGGEPDRLETLLGTGSAAGVRLRR